MKLLKHCVFLWVTLGAIGVAAETGIIHPCSECHAWCKSCCTAKTGLTACESWCASEKKCAFCSDSTNCGPGYTGINDTEYIVNGKEYVGCEKTGSINRMWPGNSVARAEHRALVIAVGGSSGSIHDEGMEWFCESYFGGANNISQVLCISSYAMPTTRSGELSNNIANLVNEIHRLSGIYPKITLIGKSMGGCKLHHAAAGTRGAEDGALKDMAIDLYIGVDPSCGLDRHFEEGLDDALEFQPNVEKLIVFYQEKEGETQTGHVCYYDGEGFDSSIHINVNSESFDVDTETKNVSGDAESLCENVGHGEMDDCEALQWTMQQLILKRTGLLP